MSSTVFQFFFFYNNIFFIADIRNKINADRYILYFMKLYVIALYIIQVRMRATFRVMISCAGDCDCANFQ